MSYVIDVYRGEVPAQKNFLQFAVFVTMFPQLVAGPIVTYGDVAEQLKERHASPENMAAGIVRFLVGLAKKGASCQQYRCFVYGSNIAVIRENDNYVSMAVHSGLCVSDLF